MPKRIQGTRTRRRPAKKTIKPEETKKAKIMFMLLNNLKGLTEAEIARRTGVEREYVRQVKNKLKAKGKKVQVPIERLKQLMPAIENEMHLNPGNRSREEIAKLFGVTKRSLEIVAKKMKTKGITIKKHKKYPRVKLGTKRANIMRELHYNPYNLTRKQIAKKHQAHPMTVNAIAATMTKNRVTIKEHERPRRTNLKTKKAAIMRELHLNPENLTPKQIALKHGANKEYVYPIRKEMKRDGIRVKQKKSKINGY